MVVIQITPSWRVVIWITTIFHDCFCYFDQNAFILRINILVFKNYASNGRDSNLAITKGRELDHYYI